MNTPVAVGSTDAPAIVVNARWITRVLGSIALVLAVVSTAIQLAIYVGGHDTVWGLIHLFSLDDEQNFPAGFSVLILLAAAQLLQLVAVAAWRARDRWRWHWALLAVGFIAMAADEGFQWHEALMPPMKALLLRHSSHLGVFNFAWVVPALALLLVLAIVFVRFLQALPARTRWAFVVAGAIYVGGAVGFEMLGGWYYEGHGPEHLEYVALWTTEESMEMAGVILFIRAIIEYLARHRGTLTLAFDEGTRGQTSPHRRTRAQ